MRNILLKIRFLGTEYHGFQSQKNASAIQNVLEEVLFSLTGEKITVTGCSRTDAGVHAEEFCLNFKTESQLGERNFIKGMNSRLPNDISVFSACEVPEDFNARYSAVLKEYKYLIYNSEERNPFYENRALHYNRRIDDELLNNCCKEFLGTHDFAAFCSAGSEVLTTERTIESCSVKRYGDLVEFKVCGNGFLYNMVRIMVGTLLEINEGKISPEIGKIIESKNRSEAGLTAPPYGLYLNKVIY